MDSNQDTWYCIGQSGRTVDGRNIAAELIKETAETYDPAVYGARINIEHYRSTWPNSELAGYGDVVEVKTESAGETVKLLARLAPTDKLIKLNRKSEKVYSSMEILPDFAGTGKAYLVGLAVTDSPASLGTTMLKFSHLNPHLYVSESIEMTDNTTTAEPTAQPTPAPAKGAFSTILQKLGGKKDEPSETAADTKLTALTADLADSAAAYTLLSEQVAEQTEQITALSDRLTALTSQLEQTPAQPARQPHNGSNLGDITY